MDRDGHNFSDPKIGEKCILDLSLVYYTIKKFQILTKKILKTILHNVIQTKLSSMHDFELNIYVV